MDTQPDSPLTPGLLSVIIPVYNERERITELVSRVLASPVDKEMILVDDFSTDGTREVLRDEIAPQWPEVKILYHDRNEGKGAAIRQAIPHIRGEFVIIQDADLEYNPQEYPALLRPMAEQKADIVYGSRFLNNRPPMKLPNRIINWLLAAMVRGLYRSPMTDEATCYKLFRTAILKGIPLTCRRFEFCPEVTAKALRRGYRIVEVPIRYEPRTHAQGKKIRWTDGILAIWTLLKFRFWR